MGASFLNFCRLTFSAFLADATALCVFRELSSRRRVCCILTIVVQLSCLHMICRSCDAVAAMMVLLLRLCGFVTFIAGIASLVLAHNVSVWGNGRV